MTCNNWTSTNGMGLGGAADSAEVAYQIGPSYRTTSDFARIYFLIGRAILYEMP